MDHYRGDINSPEKLVFTRGEVGLFTLAYLPFFVFYT